ncbi:uncharacterized protein LOC143916241 isoform X2 [Arctopsyche grandis]|uniref:uncharacterized protein LOC143916241 isoform X2 n=1 Tax=Arctopsyche grandis TaxID=121162 RepID=UPI00406D946C
MKENVAYNAIFKPFIYLHELLACQVFNMNERNVIERKTRWTILYVSIHVIASILVSGSTAMNYFIKHNYLSLMAKYFHTTSYINVMILAVLTWLLDFLFNYEEFSKLICTINRVNADISFNTFYILNIALHVSSCILMFFIFVTTSVDSGWFKPVCYLYVMFLKVDVSLIRFAVMNLLVLFQMRHLNDQLGSRLNVTLETSLFMNRRSERRTGFEDVSVKATQKEFFKLADTMDSISSLYKIHLILSPVDIFIGFVTSINNLIAAFSSIEFLKCSRIVFWTIHDLSIILGITTLCECLKYESHRTELILLKKVLQQSGDEINYDAKLFLNYLYERKFLITVTDFVTLDYKFLFEFVGAVVSYTIILMQFPEGQRHLT